MRQGVAASAVGLLFAACTGAAPERAPRDEPGPGGTDGPIADEGLEVEVTPPLVAPDPAARASAVVRAFHDGDWADQPVGADRGLEGAGAVVADLDGDALPDVLLVGADGAATRLYLQRAGGWSDAAAGLPVDSLEAGIGGSAADFDGDGDQDLLLTSQVQHRLYENLGDATFVEVTEAAGLLADARHATSSSWGDTDGDGDLDLLIGTLGPEPVAGGPALADRSWLYRNEGDGTFADVSDLLPVKVHQGRVFSTALVDADFDGLPELVSAHDVGGTPSALFWNVGGLWISDSAFISQVAGMGLGIGDLSGDGVFDVVQSSYEAVSLLESWDGFWIESANAVGIVPDAAGAGQELGWGIQVADMDNDADLDAMIGFGAWDPMVTAADQRDGLFASEEGVFSEVAPAWGLDAIAATRAVVLADLDRDGWLDVVRRNVGDTATAHVQNGGDESWLVVALEQPGANVHAIGATVVVEADGLRHVRAIVAGATMFGGGPPEAHVGLADAERVDRLEITWPDGTTSVVTDLDARTFVTVRRL